VIENKRSASGQTRHESQSVTARVPVFEREGWRKVAALVKMRESRLTDVSNEGNTARRKPHPHYSMAFD
jgi:hypothetical protein